MNWNKFYKQVERNYKRNYLKNIVFITLNNIKHKTKKIIKNI